MFGNCRPFHKEGCGNKKWFAHCRWYRGGGDGDGDGAASNGLRLVLVMLGGLCAPAKSMKVAARSIVLTGRVTTVLRLIPGLKP